MNRPGRLCKAGNGHLRRALYMGALSAAQHEPRTREFYQALQKRGKKKIQAICAIMRKYLTGLWSCIKHGQDFDATKLFSEKHRQS
ncbi:transposase, partial [Serratia sp. H1w]